MKHHGTKMRKARRMHRRSNVSRTEKTSEKTDEQGNVTTKTVTRWGECKRDYVPFKKWARENAKAFPAPSPALQKILEKSS